MLKEYKSNLMSKIILFWRAVNLEELQELPKLPSKIFQRLQITLPHHLQFKSAQFVQSSLVRLNNVTKDNKVVRDQENNRVFIFTSINI